MGLVLGSDWWGLPNCWSWRNFLLNCWRRITHMFDDMDILNIFSLLLRSRSWRSRLDHFCLFYIIQILVALEVDNNILWKLFWLKLIDLWFSSRALQLLYLVLGFLNFGRRSILNYVTWFIFNKRIEQCFFFSWLCIFIRKLTAAPLDSIINLVLVSLSASSNHLIIGTVENLMTTCLFDNRLIFLFLANFNN